MHRIDDPTAAPTLPAPRPQGTPGYFTGGSPGSSGFAATVVRYEFMNALQEEISHVVETAALTLNKTDNTQLLQALRTLFVNRTLVTSDMVIYVNPTTGNDGNSGLTAGAAFLTIQAAISAVYSKYDWNGHNGTIQLANGTYNFSVTGASAAVLQGTPFGMPYNGLTILGNAGTPGSVVINATNATCITVWTGFVNLTGITFRASGAGSNQGFGLFLQQASYAWLQNCAFGPCAVAQATAANNSVLQINNGNSFTGATPTAIYADIGGYVFMNGATITVSGLACSSAFMFMNNAAVAACAGAAFIGAATGVRYKSTQNGIIQTSGGGANFLPGDTPGITATQGQYL